MPRLQPLAKGRWEWSAVVCLLYCVWCSCGAGLVLGPAGSRPALYAPLCLLFGEFRGIPPREPPISGTRVTTNWAGERPTRHCQVRICTPFPAVSLFVLLSFLPPVRALLCGRLPHTAPLVLPARPRADRTTLLLSRHHAHTPLGGGVRHATRTSRDLVF